MMPAMIQLFECHFVAECDPSTLLSDEALRDTGAQVMTTAEARAVGFAQAPEAKAGEQVRIIAVSARDAQWLHRIIERSPMVTSYRVQEAG